MVTERGDVGAGEVRELGSFSVLSLCGLFSLAM